MHMYAQFLLHLHCMMHTGAGGFRCLCASCICRREESYSAGRTGRASRSGHIIDGSLGKAYWPVQGKASSLSLSLPCRPVLLMMRHMQLLPALKGLCGALMKAFCLSVHALLATS